MAMEHTPTADETDPLYYVVFEHKPGTGNLGLKGGMRCVQPWGSEDAYRTWLASENLDPDIRPVLEGVTPEQAQEAVASVCLARRIAYEFDDAYDPDTGEFDDHQLDRRIRTNVMMFGLPSPEQHTCVLESLTLALLVRRLERYLGAR